MLFTIFTESPGGRVDLDHKGEATQTGKGIAIFRDDKEKVLTIWCDGKPFDLQLDGCNLVKSTSNYAQAFLVGNDSVGEVWTVWLNDVTKNSQKFWFGSNRAMNIRFPRKVCTELLKGRSFAEVIEEYKRACVEEELCTLRKQVERMLSLQKALAEIYTINLNGGTGSRKKVTEIINRVEPDLMKV